VRHCWRIHRIVRDVPLGASDSGRFNYLRPGDRTKGFSATVRQTDDRVLIRKPHATGRSHLQTEIRDTSKNGLEDEFHSTLKSPVRARENQPYEVAGAGHASAIELLKGVSAAANRTGVGFRHPALSSLPNSASRGEAIEKRAGVEKRVDRDPEERHGAPGAPPRSTGEGFVEERRPHREPGWVAAVRVPASS